MTGNTAIGLLRHDLQYRKNRIDESIELMGPGDGYNLAAFDDRDTVIAYFAVVGELLELYEEKLFELEFLHSKYRDGSIVNKIGAQTISQYFDEHNIWSSELSETVRRTIKFRNKLIHDTPNMVLQTELDTLESKIQLSELALDGLEELLRESQDENNRIV